MKKAVIISQKISRHFPLPDTLQADIVITGSPSSDLKSLIDQQNQPVLAIIVLSPDEYQPLRQIIALTESHTFETMVFLIADEHELLPDCEDPVLSGIRLSPYSETEAFLTVQNAFTALTTRHLEHRDKMNTLSRLEDMRLDQEALIRIGRSLSTEKDQNTLLRMILMLSKKITGADAGSIYIVEENEAGKQIRFKYSHTFSKDLPLEEFVLPFNTKSIAGYVAVTGTVLNIPDVYALSSKDPVSFNDTFDKKNGYRSKSMLVIPMRNHIDEVIGVVQLINSKEDPLFAGNEAFGIKLSTLEDFETKVANFDSRYEHLMEAVAGQAAIAIENSRMIVQIQHQFEAFVKASVTAIESRDPATSGHSFRVAEICTVMARAINESKDKPFAAVTFTETQIKELEYAALLHDFGKVYIDLGIFMKAKKLFPRDFDNLLLKLDYLYRYVELRGIIDENDLLIHAQPGEHENLKKKHDEALALKLGRIKEIKLKVTQLNEPTVMDEDPKLTLAKLSTEIDAIQCSDIEGQNMPIFGVLEKTNLGIMRGSLNEEERKEIESHVTHTYNFVRRIPWPPEFKDIPQIALRHHEKLDGTGYPNHDKGEQVPIQARIMAIADVYDALTATDRPYKKALSHEKAIMILQKEAECGKIDADLMNLFITCNFDLILHDSKSPRSENLQ